MSGRKGLGVKTDDFIDQLEANALAEVASRHPAVKWIGLAEKNPNRAGEVAPKIGADFVTGDHRELLRRPEVTCAIIATDEHLHVGRAGGEDPW